MSHAVPRVDFSVIAVDRQDADITVQDKLQIGQQLLAAFTDIGFCYMVNSGIQDNVTADCLDSAKRFYALPVNTKKRYLRVDPESDVDGWLPSPQTDGAETLKFKPEHFDLSRPIDFKENLNLQRTTSDSIFPAIEEVPDFTEVTLRVMDQLDIVLHRCLEALGYALKLDDPKDLQHYFKHLGSPANGSQFRYAFYPKFPSGPIKEKQMRCCEHTDFGFITFLFQNETPGLQVYTREEKYVDVEPMNGAILLNIGDSLERVTGGILRSARHQVVLNEDLAKSDRYSAVYFTLGDTDAILEALCGDKEKYGEIIKAGDFRKRRFEDFFLRNKGLGTNTGQ